MRLIILCSLLLLTTACVPIWQKQPTTQPALLWQSREDQLKALTDWSFEGRTAIVQGHKGWNAGINWQETPDQYSIRLSGPFSQGGVSLDGTDHQVKMTFSDGKVMTAATPEALLVKALGMYLPVSALHDWVRGIPYQKVKVDSLKYDDEGRLTDLKQAGWDIQYLRYMPFEHMSMPAKIFIKRDQINVRLVISDWNRP